MFLSTSCISAYIANHKQTCERVPVGRQSYAHDVLKLGVDSASTCMLEREQHTDIKGACVSIKVFLEVFIKNPTKCTGLCQCAAKSLPCISHTKIDFFIASHQALFAVFLAAVCFLLNILI